MKYLLLTFALAFQGHTALAGGLECQINGTCQCLAQKTCDKNGNPIEIAKENLPIIQCGEENQAMRITLSQHFNEMPSQGTVLAHFENVALALQNFVTTATEPGSNLRTLQFITAYCSFVFQIKADERNVDTLIGATSECEGFHHQLQCKLL